jgi:CDP-diacylglycerol--glycerol-3-phosphate 3-phosphatidyltransferase
MSAFAQGIDKIRDPIVTAMAAVGLRPNHVTVLGALVAGLSGYVASTSALFLAGLVFLVGSVLDGFDGALARRTGRVSVFGAFLDSLLDRVGEGLLLLGVMVHFAANDDVLGAALAFAAFLTSVLVSYARARAEGLGFRGTGGLSPRPVRIVLLVAGLLLGQAAPLLLLASLSLVTAMSAASVVQRAVSVWKQANGRP